ncbi:MAG: DUF402 domain-containing protein [Gemmatimonadota bacterium]|nr:DUF402 domain-containing protein [Gemmatimonadota bacterium]MDH3367361.1 DUF402 domain-containing protein [Gemmatimonadota bacterium]MDH3476879.1 DUF402 domain-containing protein [Gemmatimonadota bacterium]MDH3570516.1 DUF402 domain-containing protein [Gemmatimonadota bacterium]MDH5548503.1 DUF402 domain-containing protein [Gemmatimonadota bacterium]
MARPIQLEYRRPGKATTVYRESLVLDRPDVKVLLLDPYEGRSVHVDESVIQEPGAPIVWYVFPERWYDIGRFHLRDGAFTGWYTNFCRPPEIVGDRWIGHDLFLDLWQPVQGEHRWLDEQELDDAVRQRLIDAGTRRRIQNERVMMEYQLREGAWPPPIARDIDLDQARALDVE